VKPFIAVRNFTIYCNSEGSFNWDDGGSYWGPYNYKDTQAWFRDMRREQRDEAKGPDE
jgi:hypothetical protein